MVRFISDDKDLSSIASSGKRVQVIAAGLPRCATSSIQAALESDVLGYEPCHHMAHVAPHADRAQLVLDAVRETDTARRRKILHKIFDGFASVSDFPGIVFTDDLMDMYPDAAIVLNKRNNAQQWINSIQGSLAYFGTMQFHMITYLWKTDRLLYSNVAATNAMWKRRFGLDTMFQIESYDAHNEWVRSEAKKRGRPVLEWTTSDGWEPLCKFLGKEPPKDGRAFPHLNDSATVKMVKRILLTRGLLSWAALGASIWAGWQYGPGLGENILPALKGRLVI